MKAFKTLVLAASVLVATQANASFTITYGGQTATDGSGVTSTFVPANNQLNPVNGYFIETFDKATAMALPNVGAGSEFYNIASNSDGCAINSLGAGSGVSITTSAGTGNNGSLGVRNNSVGGVAAAPAGNVNNCYAYTPGPDKKVPSWIQIDYTDLLAALPNAPALSYLGFYLGSVDTFNTLEFFTNSSATPFLTLNGPTILGANGGSSGNQVANGSNVYINISFIGQSFTKFRFKSDSIAAEFDNIVTGLTTRPDAPVPVSAPATLALLGLGLLGMSLRRRKN